MYSTSEMHAQLQNLKRAISFQFFCNVLIVTCSHMPFECIHYSLTLFIFEYVQKRIPDPLLVISPPLCKVSNKIAVRPYSFKKI